MSATILAMEVQSQRLIRDEGFRSELTSSRDLRGIDLSGRELQDLRLANKQLSEALFVDADLTNADLGGSVLIDTNLTGAELTGAVLTRVVWSNDTDWPEALEAEIRERSAYVDPYEDASLLESEFGEDLEYLKRAHLGGATLRVVDWRRATIWGGWSPDRPVKTLADHQAEAASSTPVFNSLTEVPAVGDELRFLDVKRKDEDGGFYHGLTVEPGDRLLVRAYVHNNADVFSDKAVPEDTRVRILVPTGSERSLRMLGYVTASSSSPQTVSAAIDLRASEPVRLKYVSGSAEVFANDGEYELSDEIIVDEGVLVGTNGPDGRVLPGFENIALVLIDVDVLAGE